MEEDTEVMKVKPETMAVATHFRLKLQLEINALELVRSKAYYRTHFLGFLGSAGPSQSTTNTLLSGEGFSFSPELIRTGVSCTA